MSPLQRIGLGLILVVLPADFPAHPHPVWNYYDLLPPPIGWLLVLSGTLRLMRTADIDLRTTRASVILALVVSLPMWFPQLNHYVVPQYNHGVSQSWQWFVALPSWLVGFFLSKAIGDAAIAREPRERSMAGWFGILRWGFVAAAVMPAVVYGAGLGGLDNTMHLIIGMVELCLIIAMFTYQRREWLGGPGPRVWAAPKEAVDATTGEAKDPVRRPSDWETFKAEREKAREEMRERRRVRRENAKRPG